LKVGAIEAQTRSAFEASTWNSRDDTRTNPRGAPADTPLFSFSCLVQSCRGAALPAQKSSAIAKMPVRVEVMGMLEANARRRWIGPKFQRVDSRVDHSFNTRDFAVCIGEMLLDRDGVILG